MASFFFPLKCLCSRGVPGEIYSDDFIFLLFYSPQGDFVSATEFCQCFDGSLRLYYKAEADALWESQRNQIPVISEHNRYAKTGLCLFCFCFCSTFTFNNSIMCHFLKPSHIYNFIYFWFAEKAREYLHKTGRFIVIGGIISPVHDSYGKPVREPICVKV